MKVIHCINSPQIGGIERLVIELIIEQKKQGIDVSLMLDTQEGQYYNYLSEQNIPILDSGISTLSLFSIKKINYLKNTFNNFDIIHLHNFSLLRSIAAKKSSAKIVYTIHGLSKGIRKENMIKYFVRETLKKYFLNRVDFFCANSSYTLYKAQNHYSLNEVAKGVVLNGIKLPEITNQINGKKTTNFTIGMVSRFTPRKRIERLIEAFRIFLEKGGTGKLILVGDGTTFDEIKKLTFKKKINGFVEMPGYSTEVHKFYEIFDICAHSSDNEGFGLIGVEAYIHGNPIIAFSDSGGLKEVIAPLEPENIVQTEEQMAERMLYFYKNQALITVDAQMRINYAKSNFSIERMERDYFKVYTQVLQQ